TYTLSSIGFEAPGHGFDLDGDGKIDNALGYLAPVANQVIDNDVASGFSRYVFEIERWDNATADDPDVAFVSYSGVDTDQPPDSALSRAYLPQLGSGTFLDLVLSQGKQADIDVDGDGLETIDYAGGQIVSCTDGDGTQIPGPQCVCDPRIADGYSIAVFANGV